MTEQLIDLTKLEFWIACLAAVLVLTPVTRALPRKWVWAGVNLGFVALLLRLQALAVFGAVFAAYLLLRAIAGSRHRGWFTALTALCVLGLFILHKLPALSANVGLTTINSGLSMVGFSYVALRMVEILRAVFEKRHGPPDLLSTINYLLPFHMLAAGPIQGYDEFVSQPREPKRTTHRDVFAAGERIASGLFKKFVLAMIIKDLFLTDFHSSGIYFFIEIQFFYLWLYLDFSAYSDIAVGVGRLIGVATPENFNRPYLARNAIDFWERWHISLSMFIRRNIFVPIQLHLSRRTDGRRPLLCASLAFTVAFVLCGLWHNLNINFMIWGGVHAAGLVAANLYRHFLKGKLGAGRVKAYLASRRIRLVAQVATYEFVAVSLLALFYP